MPWTFFHLKCTSFACSESSPPKFALLCRSTSWTPWNSCIPSFRTLCTLLYLCAGPRAGRHLHIQLHTLCRLSKLVPVPQICDSAQAHKLDAMEFFKKFAVDPEELPDTGEGLFLALFAFR